MNGTTHIWSLPLYALFRLKDYVMEAGVESGGIKA